MAMGLVWVSNVVKSIVFTVYMAMITLDQTFQDLSFLNSKFRE